MEHDSMIVGGHVLVRPKSLSSWQSNPIGDHQSSCPHLRIGGNVSGSIG